MITVKDVVYNEIIDATIFTYVFEKSGYRQSTSLQVDGKASNQQIIESLQPRYERWIKLNDIT